MINSSRDRNLRKGASLKFCLTQVGELAKVMQSRASKATVKLWDVILSVRAGP